MSDNILDATKLIQQAAEMLEKELPAIEERPRCFAKMYLAWDNLVKAHSLLTEGELTPDNVIWGREKAKKIIAERAR